MNASTHSNIVNALTIDVEDYFQVHAFSKVIHMADWGSFEHHIEKNTYLILDLLDSSNGPSWDDQTKGIKPRGTFFVLGWVAERFPELVREIQRRGHEVGCHGYGHQVIFEQTKRQFREDVLKAKGILEDLTGEEVFGYRAPTYSINKDTLWALEVLFELGFRYDSSIFPINHDVYGLPMAPRFPHLIIFDDQKAIQMSNPQSGIYDFSGLESNYSRSIVEFPMSTIRIFGYNLPISGGGYFRFYPYYMTRYFLKTINNKYAKAFIFYIHPWEIDANLPKLAGAGALSRFRTYFNIAKTESRFKKLLSDFHFCSISHYLFG